MTCLLFLVIFNSLLKRIKMSKEQRIAISLTTDFGLRDPFVGVMKGVILNINPSATIVDISHEIANHDLLEAAFILYSAYKYFPRGTIHLVVVDPGVGTSRRPLLAVSDNYRFIAPDNGVLTYIYREEALKEVITITSEGYFLPQISHTFHGRDIFAPVAGWLSTGIAPQKFGQPVTDFVRLPLSEPVQLDDSTLKGAIIHIDRFGNLITNIDKPTFERMLKKGSGKKFVLQVGGMEVIKLVETYAQVKKGEIFALFNSFGLLEIAGYMQSAARLLKLRRGDEVLIKFLP